MKEVFVELERIAMDNFKKEIHDGYVHAYKGTTKKWQVLDDDCFDRDQIEKL